MTLLKLALTSLFWAMLLFLAKVALAEMSPASVAAWRFLLAAVVLLVIVYLREGLDWRGISRHWVALMIMGVIGVLVFNLMLFDGVRETSTINASLIMGLCPIMIAILSAAMTGEGIRFHEGIGLILSLAGAGIVVCGGSVEALLRMDFHSGDLKVLAAAGCWAFYSAIPRRFIPELPATQVTVVTVTIGAILLACHAMVSAPDFLVIPSGAASAAIVAMSMLGTVLVFLWWNDGVRRIGPQKAAPFMNVVPLFAMVIGLMLGEQITLSQVTGGLLVVVGVGLSLQVAKKAPSQATSL